MKQTIQATAHHLTQGAGGWARRWQQIIPLMMIMPLASAAAIEQDVARPLYVSMAHARVALVPRTILFRAPLDEDTIWVAGCVYEAPSSTEVNLLLESIRASVKKRTSQDSFLISNAIEISGEARRPISLFFGDDMVDANHVAMVRGRYIDAEDGLAFEFEADSSFAATMRSWVIQQGNFLSPTSPSYCR